METDYYDRVDEHHKLQNGGFIVEKRDEGRHNNDETSKFMTMPSYLGTFKLSNSKRLWNCFRIIKDGYEINSV